MSGDSKSEGSASAVAIAVKAPPAIPPPSTEMAEVSLTHTEPPTPRRAPPRASSADKKQASTLAEALKAPKPRGSRSGYHSDESDENESDRKVASEKYEQYRNRGCCLRCWRAVCCAKGTCCRARKPTRPASSPLKPGDPMYGMIPQPKNHNCTLFLVFLLAISLIIIVTFATLAPRLCAEYRSDSLRGEVFSNCTLSLNGTPVQSAYTLRIRETAEPLTAYHDAVIKPSDHLFDLYVTVLHDESTGRVSFQAYSPTQTISIAYLSTDPESLSPVSSIEQDPGSCVAHAYRFSAGDVNHTISFP